MIKFNMMKSDMIEVYIICDILLILKSKILRVVYQILKKIE